jgi:hypothetical protein
MGAFFAKAVAMFASIRAYLHRFRASRPGRRFQDHYERKKGSRGGSIYRCAAVAGGVLLFLIGLFFLAVPGPGIPIVLAGAALLAQQSRGTAQLLDRTELRLRRLFRSRGRG